MEVAIIAAVIVVAILFVLFMNTITRLKFEKRFRDWQETESMRWQTEMEQARKSAINQSRAVLGGKFTEQMVPYLPDFKYDPTEARFIGSPIDLIVFPGLAKGDPEEIVILEIKTGPAGQLTPQERKIRQLIEEGMVRWEIIHRQSGGEV
ncbi:Holliday junction resolvase-like protein [Chloroflexota bacterium]